MSVITCVFFVFTLVSFFAPEAATAGAIPKSANKDARWERRWLAPRDAPIKLHIALRQDDGGAAAENHLMALSDPDSPLFRQHLGSERAPYLSTPADGAVHAVEYWLWQHGLLRGASLSSGMLNIDTTVRQAERLLNTTYFSYSDGTNEVVRTELFYVPDSVVNQIDFIAPTTMFPRPSVNRGVEVMNGVAPSDRASDDMTLQQRAGCGSSSFTTPSCVRQIYDINYEAKPSRVTYAVYGTEAASYSSTDLETYLAQYNPPAAQADAKYVVVGNGDSAEPSGIAAKFETALDTQTMTGLAWPAQGIFYNHGGVFGPSPGQVYDRFVTFLQELIHNKTVPSVVSFSESMPEDRMDAAYARRLCNMMAQVGTRGVTLLFSSGDNGPNGDQPSGAHTDIFEPEFPASCPWVTAVGGTTDLAAETAATQSTIGLVGKISYVASGGGFSTLFAAPAYQQYAVDNYTAKHVPESYATVSGYNAKGRGIPDVSAFSTNFPTVVDFLTAPVGGTSASTPLWAAVVALLNDYEASKGRPPLGFLNPWLYGLKSGLKDITTGGNNVGACYALEGCHLPQTLGYNVTEGWDPVTGLGSPIFSQLTAALDARAPGAVTGG